MTKRVHRAADGYFHVNGKKFRHNVGSRSQVVSGFAIKTAGDLTKDDLLKNKWGRIVSKSKHHTAKKERRLQAHGYTARRGRFGAVKMTAIHKK